MSWHNDDDTVFHTRGPVTPKLQLPKLVYVNQQEDASVLNGVT